MRLLHGVCSDRTSQLNRAHMLKQSGDSVLLVDLPAHGESGGDRITFGWRLAAGVLPFLARHLRQAKPVSATAPAT